MKQVVKNEVFERQPDGSTILVRVEELEIDVLTNEELVEYKQNEILRIYEEIIILKNANE